ncbi:hypothetical protein ACE7GA_12855 [Roseomonas sp. CCTCC AB2023176]|uniref:hypothetical protein n=1 Tax=Roseomonas sp. CCTCC AB2023176 TaxID=3342640 RepID=UPI0035D7C2FC
MRRRLTMTKTAVPAALLALGLLAGCGSGTGIPTPPPRAPCPSAGILSDAADLTRYRAGAAADISTTELEARIVGLDRRCDFAPRNAGLEVTVRVRVQAQRGPALAGTSARIPYFVAVTDREENRVFSRGTDAVTVNLPRNGTGDSVLGEEISVLIPGDPNVAATRRIVVGFVLTPEEVALNRRRGPRS